MAAGSKNGGKNCEEKRSRLRSRALGPEVGRGRCCLCSSPSKCSLNWWLHITFGAKKKGQWVSVNSRDKNVNVVRAAAGGMAGECLW